VLWPVLHRQGSNKAVAGGKESDYYKSIQVAVVAGGGQRAPQKKGEEDEAQEHEGNEPTLWIVAGNEGGDREQHAPNTIENVKAGD
jgi:hypothetical protein